MLKARFQIVIVLLCLLASVVKAEESWLGGLRLHSEIRGRISDTDYTGGEIHKNIADYQTLTLYFEYYQQGVTETEKDLWQKIEARVEVIHEATGALIKGGFIPLVGHTGNNAIYAIRVNSFSPDTFGELPSDLKNGGHLKARMNILINGQVRVSLPMDFVYQP